MFYKQFDDIDRITLYEKYKLVEKTEIEVNGVWKGAHLLLFFLAFVFGSFCTFCFHMLMYLFDEKCVLFPKLKSLSSLRAHLLLFFLAFVFGSFCTFCFHMLMYLFDEKCVLFPKLKSLSSLRQNIIYEFIPEDKDVADMLPVDFLSTQWVEKSACLLPTYVPLVSGIFGLVWTTLFLMCSIGSRVLTGLQRPWRVLPPVFLFSVVMGGVCVYTSAVTHVGLQELCVKLNEITGSSSCSYTINVVTLAYQRRIRGVYQATRLTIASAWLHTACWLLSALLALARVLLVVDFKLVRVSVQLQGNIDRMLERHERQIRTVSPAWTERLSIPTSSQSSIRVHFMKKLLRPSSVDRNGSGDLLHFNDLPRESSESALVTTERLKIDKLAAINAASEQHQFIVIMLYNLLDTVDGSQSLQFNSSSSSSSTLSDQSMQIARQYGQQQISSNFSLRHPESGEKTSADIRQAEEIAAEIAAEIKQQLQARLNRDLNELKVIVDDTNKKIAFKSSLILTSEARLAVDKNRADVKKDTTNESEPSTSKGKTLKPSLKQAGVQTDEKPKDKSHKVKIASRADLSERKTSQDQETQTKKEKQD